MRKVGRIPWTAYWLDTSDVMRDGGAEPMSALFILSLAIEKLANRISAGIEPNLAQSRHSRRAFVPPGRQLSCVNETKET